ncbi:unnamed protein product [Pieris macdunnoughi]|uniref:Uncharacterized protein n=1 Tax=Pieris macdunnoughi TaxID=345717 RepID=A0A821NXT5_9NEOP|nr:unnamed protein product [Pieris macdunnoughi]
MRIADAGRRASEAIWLQTTHEAECNREQLHGAGPELKSLSDGGDQKSALYAQSLFRKVCTELFGEAGVGHVDVLSVHGSQVVVRLRPDFLRSFRAAIALSARRIHVCREAPSLQALL